MSEGSWQSTGGEARKSFEEEIQELLRAEPFERFFVVMTSGQRFEVSNPVALAIGPVTFTVYTRETTARLRKSQIAQIYIPEAAA